MIEVNLNCESEVEPSTYMIENIIDGKCDIVLNDNIENKTKIDENGEIKEYYTYDIYRIVRNTYRDTLENDLSDSTSFLVWLNYAKEQYQNRVEKVSIEERLSAAEAVIAEILGGEV